MSEPESVAENPLIYENERQKIERILIAAIRREKRPSGEHVGHLANHASSDIMNHLSQVATGLMQSGVIQRLEKELLDCRKQKNKIQRAHDELAKHIGLWSANKEENQVV